MPKESRLPVVTIYNMWGVKGDVSDKSYKVRFRDDKSSDGWATAFIPKCDAVTIEEQAKRNMFRMTVTDENLKVRIRRKTDHSFAEFEVLIRQPLDGDQPGFKELYEQSRALAKADKAKKEAERSSPFSDHSAYSTTGRSCGFDSFDDFEF